MVTDDALDALQRRLGYRWKQARLLQQALTHRSFSADHNERLEFLGDAVLSACISALLFERFPDQPEGDLTRVRAHLVREDTLHQLALVLGIPKVLRLSDGEAKGGGAQRPSLLADAVEALIGAVYVEAGYADAAAMVSRLWSPLLVQPDAARWQKDGKTALQEWLQGRRMPVPVYRIVATRGQAHNQEFDVECAVSALSMTALGTGRTRRMAEQEAARRLLDRLESQTP